MYIHIIYHSFYRSSPGFSDPEVKSFVKGPLDLVMGLIVVVNLSMMAAATQATGHLADVALSLASGAPWGLTEQGFETAELVFYFIYITDVVVRILVLRSEWYFDRREGWMYMNFFDLLLVSVHTFEILLLPVCLAGQIPSTRFSHHMFSIEQEKVHFSRIDHATIVAVCTPDSLIISMEAVSHR